MTAIYNAPHDMVFEKRIFKRLKTIKYKKAINQLDNDEDDHFYLKDLEGWDIFDVVRYSK